jgi:hypothetical protein
MAYTDPNLIRDCSIDRLKGMAEAYQNVLETLADLEYPQRQIISLFETIVEDMLSEVERRQKHNDRQRQ